MTPMTIVKLTLALISAILFFLGISRDSPPLRWAAIAFLAIAVLLRWIDRFRGSR